MPQLTAPTKLLLAAPVYLILLLCAGVRGYAAEGEPRLLRVRWSSYLRAGVDPPSSSLAFWEVSSRIMIPTIPRPRGLIRGQSNIVAADASRTTILGNFRMSYTQEPAEYREFPWHTRLFTPGHIDIECDPKVWSAVKTLILRHLENSLPTANDPGEWDFQASGAGGDAPWPR
jgi:hypothetical protein